MPFDEFIIPCAGYTRVTKERNNGFILSNTKDFNSFPFPPLPLFFRHFWAQNWYNNSMNKRVLAAALLFALCLSACARGPMVEITPSPKSGDAPGLSPTPAGSPAPDPGGAGEYWITFLNVGKADCALLCANGLYYLVDTGAKGGAEALAETLHKLGVAELAGIFLTHTHNDHTGGAKKIAKALPVHMFYRAAITTPTKKGKDELSEIAADAGVPETKLVAGDALDLNGARLEVLGPTIYNGEDDNDNSLVFRLVMNGRSVLFTGDMQFAQERTLMDKTLKADVLKVGNHGNPDATGEAFAAAVDPKIAVVSTNTLIDTDSANPRVLNALAGADCYVTEHFEVGVQLDFSGEEIEVSDPGFRPRAEAAGLAASFYAQLINRAHLLAADYVPEGLVEIGPMPGLTLKQEGMLGYGEAVAAFEEMIAAAGEAGVSGFYLVSVYRSYQHQQSLWNNKLAADASYGSDPSVPIVTAYPGASEHQAGLAFDISAADARALSQSFAKTVQGKWLYANSWRFGFILRYPEHAQEETGIVFEPWHFRYVGKPLAAYLYRRDITLERFYLESLPEN